MLYVSSWRANFSVTIIFNVNWSYCILSGLFAHTIALLLLIVYLKILILVQIWDLASGKLKLSLTGHISTVRGVIVSARSPYLFSCGEDKQVKCWDLEYNKVICSFLNWN